MGQQSLSTRLNALLDAHKLTQQSIFRLSKLVTTDSNVKNGSINSSTRSLAAGTEADQVKQELVSDIHDSLKQQEEDLELLRQEIEEVFESGLGSGGSANRARNSEWERERARVAAQAARLGEDLRHARALFRNAQLSAKRATEVAKQRERTLLCASLQSSPIDDNSNTTTSEVSNISTNGTIIRRRGPEKPSFDPDAILADASSDVVAALRRSHALLSTELSRSRFAQETLDQSGRALADLGERYSSVNDLLGASKALVTDLLRSQKSDSWYLQTALYLLVGTLGWLIFRRFLWGPIWLLVWLPVKTGFGIFGWVLSLIGLGIGGAGEVGKGAELSLVSASTGAITTTSTTPLIVKPSATDRPPARPNPDPQQQASVRVGMGGGKGADQQQEQNKGTKGESLTDQVGNIIDESNRNESQDLSQEKEKGGNTVKGEKPKTVVYRGDGEPLAESDAPRNPKKRMMEAEEQQSPSVGVKEEL